MNAIHGDSDVEVRGGTYYSVVNVEGSGNCGNISGSSEDVSSELMNKMQRIQKRYYIVKNKECNE